MIIRESGVAVDVPDATVFRIGDNAGFKALGGNRIQEMDVGWFKGDVLFLVEFKGFTDFANPHYNQIDLSFKTQFDDWLNRLKLKAEHSVSMLFSKQCDIGNFLPASDTGYRIKLFFLIKSSPIQALYLQPIQDELRSQLKPLLAIFKVQEVGIIDYDYAIKENLADWIV